jgi:hypothetical protein
LEGVVRRCLELQFFKATRRSLGHRRSDQPALAHQEGRCRVSTYYALQLHQQLLTRTANETHHLFKQKQVKMICCHRLAPTAHKSGCLRTCTVHLYLEHCFWYVQAGDLYSGFCHAWCMRACMCPMLGLHFLPPACPSPHCQRFDSEHCGSGNDSEYWLVVVCANLVAIWLVRGINC